MAASANDSERVDIVLLTTSSVDASPTLQSPLRSRSVPPDMHLDGIAVIRESERAGLEAQRGVVVAKPWDWGFNVVGKTKYWFRLEVRIPGHEPYEVQREFKVPRKVENTGFFSRANKLQAGIELPVRVTPGALEDVDIDWDRFLASPGREQAIKGAAISAQNTQLRAHYERNPKMLARLRADGQLKAQGWANAVRGGAMTREVFEQSVAMEVESGRMDPADADAARRMLDQD